MEKLKKIFIGVDVSKDKLDVYCKDSNEVFIISNDKKGHEKLAQWIDCHKYDHSSIWLGFEDTGIYHTNLEKFCISNLITYTKINPLALKRSMGLTRGKNDKIDSIRICNYLYEKRESVKITIPRLELLDELKRYITLREKLVENRAGIKSTPHRTEGST